MADLSGQFVLQFPSMKTCAEFVSVKRSGSRLNFYLFTNRYKNRKCAISLLKKQETKTQLINNSDEGRVLTYIIKPYI